MTMKAEHESLLANERGVTLVELLASIVIISIILISVISIFNLTMKANRTSEDIIDATYVAQTEIERVYALSKKDTPNLSLNTLGYQANGEKNGWKVYKEINPQYDGFFVQIRKKVQEDTGLMR